MIPSPQRAFTAPTFAPRSRLQPRRAAETSHALLLTHFPPADALQLALQLGLAPATLLAAILEPKPSHAPAGAAAAAAPSTPGAAAGSGAAGRPPGGHAACMASQPALRSTLVGWLVFNTGDVIGDVMAAVAEGVTRGAVSDAGGEQTPARSFRAHHCT